MTYTSPEHDLALCRQHGLVVGMDEVGRGCVAGPIVACAVVLSADVLLRLSGLKVADSKQLKASERASIVLAAQPIVSPVFAVRSASEVDLLGIQQCNKAIFLELGRAYSHACLLADGNLSLPGFLSLVKGESISFAIALASIFAKEYRDGLMRELDAAHPVYGFSGHKGYGTAKHIAAIRTHGMIPGLHRTTFLRGILSTQGGQTDALLTKIEA